MITRNGLLAIASFGLAGLVATLGCKGGGSDQGSGLTPAFVGQACNLTVNAGPSQAVVNMSAAECPTGTCLKPVQDPTKPDMVPPTGAICTAECISDSDCVGDLRDPSNPGDTRCENGFVCAVAYVVGPLCCKKYCLCKDFLSNSGVPTPVACEGDAAATCATGGAPAAGVGQQTDLYVSVAPVRKVDLVFMIDNSPSMAPKVEKLKKNFPSLLTALKDPSDGTYPDLRVALIDSDLGSGGQYASGSCGPNDSNHNSPYGDFGNFQMRGASGCGVTGDALWLEYTKGKAINYDTSKDIGTVFGCLASNLGTVGCGLEHQLQAFEFALVAKFSGTPIGRDSRQDTYLRQSAFLGLVILSDEDDCSAAPNDGMFGDTNHPDLKGESASLRCATRAHQCNGANLTNTPPGYPTTAKFETTFASCSARTDACPNTTDGTGSTDTTQATSCSPLKDLRHLAYEIKGLKSYPEEQILVAGIFGWPRNGSDGKPDFPNAQYKIDYVPNPNPQDAAHPQVWDYWPVCYDPDHLPKTAGAFDADAWGWGAQGGLRLSAFIDEFSDNGLKYSVCERDFSAAMKGIGDGITKKLQNLCVGAKLMDVDPVAPGLQPLCRVVYRTPRTLAGGQVVYDESPQSLPLCPAGATPQTVISDCWQLVYDTAKCPRTGQLITLVRTAAEIAAGPLTEGTKIGMQCWTCPDLVSAPGCQY